MSHLRAMSGLDVLVAGNGPDLRGERLGLILHPASVTSDLRFSADALLTAGSNEQVWVWHPPGREVIGKCILIDCFCI